MWAIFLVCESYRLERVSCVDFESVPKRVFAQYVRDA